MDFIRFHIKGVRSGGMPVLWRKMRAFPRWFATSKYGNRMAYFGCRMAVSLRPDWAEAHILLAEVLISLGRFDEAFVTYKQTLLLKSDWGCAQNIAIAFMMSGQGWATLNTLQEYLNVQNDFASVHQLDKLGIRFLIDFSATIGHIAMLDSYVKMGFLRKRSTARPIVLAAMPANHCYLGYWRRYLPDIITDPLAVALLSPLAKYLEDHICAVMDSSGKQIYESYTTERAIQAQWELECRGPLLTLSDADHERGWNCLRTLGVPTDAWFVSLHARSAFTSFNNGRDVDINTYRLAMETIVARGGWVIRMGDPSMPPLPPMMQVIDYAHSTVRSDWMDVFLWARCRFFVGTSSGPILVPPTFGVPCVETNWVPLGARLWFNKNLCVFKLNWSKREARHLNMAEVISSLLGWSEYADYHASQGIKLVDNTSEEINDVVIEMLDRLEGKLQYSREDEELQERFNILFISVNTAKARIGRDFLRKWEHLL